MTPSACIFANPPWWAGPAIAIGAFLLGWYIRGRGLGRAFTSPENGAAAKEYHRLVLDTPEEDASALVQSELVGKVAHAIRNPLTGILMSADLLRDEATSPSTARTLAKIGELGAQIQETLARIQAAMALEACQFHLELEALDLDLILREAAEAWRGKAGHKQLVLDLTLSDSPGGIVGDPAFVREILDELLSNAVKFSPPSGTICLGGEAREDTCRIWVSDQGPGLTEQDRGKLFRRFEDLSSRPTGEETRLGLGLWMARMKAETLGGSLWEEPQPKGARFVVEFLRSHRS